MSSQLDVLSYCCYIHVHVMYIFSNRDLFHDDVPDFHRIRQRGRRDRHGKGCFDSSLISNDQTTIEDSIQFAQVFCLIMMIVSSLLYAAIFGHVTTIIHNMTAATAKYHEMLSSVKEFMMLGCRGGERLASLMQSCTKRERARSFTQPVQQELCATLYYVSLLGSFQI